MPRPTPDQRLDALIDAALRVFADKGFRRAQMDDVAAEMRVSKGTLYNYVESKEALFYLLVERAFGGRPGSPPALPVPTPRRGAVLGKLRSRLAEQARLPALEAALGRDRSPDPVAELEEIVRQFYAVIAATRLVTTALERSAADIPEIAALWYGETRQPVIADVTRYLEARMRSGQLRAVPDAATSARLILEVITWFARHRHGDPSGAEIDDALALQTVVDFIVNALAVRS